MLEWIRDEVEAAGDPMRSHDDRDRYWSAQLAGSVWRVLDDRTREFLQYARETGFCFLIITACSCCCSLSAAYSWLAYCSLLPLLALACLSRLAYHSPLILACFIFV